MSEKLCLQWNDFTESVNSAFGRLRNDKELADVTLACEDGQEIEAHKVILAASSPFFEKILQKSKHPHPLIYLRGYKSKNILAILDFLYLGEANVFQEDFESFLAIAEEIQLKGFKKQTSKDLIQEHEETQNAEPIQKGRGLLNPQLDLKSNKDGPCSNSTAEAISNQSNTDLQKLEEKVKTMMEKGQKMIQVGKKANGTPIQFTSFSCKVCGKEGPKSSLRDHIEARHLEGICIPCDVCGIVLSSRASLKVHKGRYHIKIKPFLH